MTGPDCSVMYNLINTHTHAHSKYHRSPLGRICQFEWHIMTRRTGPDCAVICNLINTHTRCKCTYATAVQFNLSNNDVAFKQKFPPFLKQQVSGLFLMFFWCPCMAINVNVQYNGGFLPDIILLTQCYLHHRGTCLNAMKRFCICSL